MEVNRSNGHAAKEWFKRTYRRREEGEPALTFPLGIKFRRVAEWGDVANPSSRDNLLVHQERQLTYNQKSRAEHVWQLVSIDTPESKSGMTICQMIAKIKTEDGDPIIHFVERSWRGEDFVYQPVPSREKEAAMYMHGLLPFLQSKHGKGVNKFFTAKAVLQAKNVTWDITRGGMVTEEDEDLACLDDADDAWNLKPTRASRTDIPKRREVEEASITSFSLADDSVPTVNSGASNHKSVRSSQSRRTSVSGITLESTNLRIEELGRQFGLLMETLTQGGNISLPDPRRISLCACISVL